MSSKYRLMINFVDKQALVDAVELMKDREVIPRNVGVFECDALDFTKDSGVTRKYTFILLNERAEEDGRQRMLHTETRTV